jgi:hypothetical protein
MRLARATGVSGFLFVLLGAWGALIPFVGPYFDYSFGSNAAWQYTADRFWLNILPGAVAVLAGLLLLRATTRRARAFGGWLGLLAGVWFVVGPAVSLTWEQARGPIGPPLGGDTRQMLELLGYFYALGALLIAVVAFASGGPVSRLQPGAAGGAYLARPTSYVAPRARRFSLRRRSASADRSQAAEASVEGPEDS